VKKFDQNSFSLTVRKSNYTLPLSGFKISKNRLPLMKKKSLLTLKTLSGTPMMNADKFLIFKL
jgi:hypothetical protein